VYALNTGFQKGSFTLLLYLRIDLSPCLVHQFLYPCRMNPTVNKELFQSHTRNLAPDRIKSG
jgi:hypothetical protein